MDRPLISVVIPVYNVELYIEKAIESVINQTYKNLDIILVDDGSIDNSGFICDRYALADQRVRVIHKTNGGLSDARNKGVSLAKGEWIFFLDSDDFLSLNCFEHLLKLSNKGNFDLIIGNETKFYDEKELDKIRINKHSVEILTGAEAVVSYFYRRIPGYACGKMIRKEIVKAICFPVGRLFEDAFTVYRYLYMCNKVAYTDETIYFYRQRKSGSIVNSKYTSKQLDIIVANQQAMHYFSKAGTEVKQAIYSKRFVSGVDVLRKIPLKRKYSEDRKIAISEIVLTRKRVLKDDNNSLLVRSMAIVAIFNPTLLGLLAKIKKLFVIKRV